MSDLSDIYDATEFRDLLPETALWTPAAYPHPSSKTTQVSASMSREYIESNGMEGFKPILLVMTIDAQTMADGDQIRHTDIITGNYTDYFIRGIHPDGYVYSQLILEKQ